MTASEKDDTANREITTDRLLLRPLRTSDAESVCRWAGAREIADTTLSIPHPYTPENAEAWIQKRIDGLKAGKSVSFAIVLRDCLDLIGAVGLKDIDSEHQQAELGFWIGVPWWRQGYAAEAARAALSFGFGALKLNRIYAHHMVRNPASGKVLKNIGMKEEGILREHVKKWGVFEDVTLYAILKKDLGQVY